MSYKKIKFWWPSVIISALFPIRHQQLGVYFRKLVVPPIPVYAVGSKLYPSLTGIKKAISESLVQERKNVEMNLYAASNAGMSFTKAKKKDSVSEVHSSALTSSM